MTKKRKKARKRSAARAGLPPTISAPSAIARAPCRWATRRRNGRTARSSRSSIPGRTRSPATCISRRRVDDVKRGILMAGGFPMELPALSLSESFLKPTTMLYRNLLAMDAEELLRGHPVDGVVLMGGCDKTTPALLLGATSMNLPGDLSAGRADAARQLEGQDAGLGLGCLEILGRAPRRKNLRQGLGRCRGRHRPQLRHLHDHGHRLDHDRDRRIDRHDAAGRVLDSGRRRRPHPHGFGMRPPHRRDGLGRSDAATRSRPARRSRTPSRWRWRWAARPMRSFI